MNNALVEKRETPLTIQLAVMHKLPKGTTLYLTATSREIHSYIWKWNKTEKRKVKVECKTVTTNEFDKLTKVTLL